MSSWFERSRKRGRELAEGADVDLMQANRRRSRVGLGLIGLGVLLGLLTAKVRVPAVLQKVLGIASGISFLVGIVLGKWAQVEHNFLTEPEREGPPEIFSDTRR